MHITVYTDGGCSGNPGPGGWGYIIIPDGGDHREGLGFELETTNNRMELMAAIKALTAIKPLPRIQVTMVTDSQYVKNGITSWVHGWKKNDWMSSSGGQVKNIDLWQELDALNAIVKPNWEWVKGHAGDEHNERCDALTQEAIANAKKELGIAVAPKKEKPKVNALAWQSTPPPKDRMIMRWHHVWKCPIPVLWSNDKDLQSPGTPWVCGTKSVSWPEESFLPEWAECPLPPARR